MYQITNISASDLAGICIGNKNLAPGTSTILAEVSLQLRSLEAAKTIKITQIMDQLREPAAVAPQSRPAEPPLAMDEEASQPVRSGKKKQTPSGGN